MQPCRCQCRKLPTVPRLPFRFLADDPVVTRAGPSTSQASTKKGNAPEYTPETWDALLRKEAEGQGPARKNHGSGKRKVSFAQPPATATNGTPRHRNRNHNRNQNQQPRQITAQVQAGGNVAAGNHAAVPANGTPHRHNQRDESKQVSTQVQAWGDFAAGGHVDADQKIKDDIMEKVAEADQKRAEEKRQLVDAENERNLFGGEDEPTQTEYTAAIGGGEMEPAQTDLTAASGEGDAEGEGEGLLVRLDTPSPGNKVKRVEEWRPVSPVSPTRDREGGRAEEVSLLDLENDF